MINVELPGSFLTATAVVHRDSKVGGLFRAYTDYTAGHRTAHSWGTEKNRSVGDIFRYISDGLRQERNP